MISQILGEVAFVDFYFEGFSEDAKEVTLKLGQEYTLEVQKKYIEVLKNEILVLKSSQ